MIVKNKNEERGVINVPIIQFPTLNFFGNCYTKNAKYV